MKNIFFIYYSNYWTKKYSSILDWNIYLDTDFRFKELNLQILDDDFCIKNLNFNLNPKILNKKIRNPEYYIHLLFSFLVDIPYICTP